MSHIPGDRDCSVFTDLPYPSTDLSYDQKQLLELHLSTCKSCQARYAKAIEQAETAWLNKVAEHGQTHRNNDLCNPLPVITGFDIERRIAHGGQGVVYLARDIALQRTVAIKHLKWERLANERDRELFLHEAAAAASLDHQNIVRIYSFGEVAGVPYLVMEYLAGGTLSHRMKAEQFTPEQAADLIAKLADAIQFAHDQRIIHRDLKPSNILFANNTLDTPKVVDFGIAKRIPVEGTDVTPSHHLFGTPQYVAPELIDQSMRPSPQADIYSLGAILYLLLTGRVPFAASSDFEALRLATTSTPILPRTITPAIPEPLELICLHCLETNPEKRYQSAAQLAQDLTAFLHHEPISLRPPTTTQKWMRALHRQKRVALVALGLIGLVSLLCWYAVQPRVSETTQIRATNPFIQELLQEPDLSKAVEIAATHRANGTIPSAELRQVHSDLPLNAISRRNAALYLATEDASSARELTLLFLTTNPVDYAQWEKSLTSYKESLAPYLWEVLINPDEPVNTSHVRAYRLLSGWEPKSPMWTEHEKILSQRFLDISSFAGNGDTPLIPHSNSLVMPLLTKLQDGSTSEIERNRITSRLVAGCQASPSFREEIQQTIARHMNAATTLAALRPWGAILGRLAMAKQIDFVRPYVVKNDDPTVSSIVLEQLTTITEPDSIIEYVRIAMGEADAQMRRWLLLALCRSRIAPSRISTMSQNLVKQIHATDPDCGVHAAAEHLLLKWNRFDLVHSNRENLRLAQLANKTPNLKANWFIGPERTTMCVMPANTNLPQHNFAISLHEISKLQFENFMREHKDYAPVQIKRTGEPAVYIPAHHARAYCNWLSKEDNLEICYVYDPKTMRYEPVPDAMTKTGYRLPTESEWKIASQGSSKVVFSFGRFPELISLFGNCKLPTQEKSVLRYVCQQLPNDYGLFDMYGNASELCEDYQTRGLVVIGGSYRYSPEDAKKMSVKFGVSQEVDMTTGFRVVRTLPTKR